MDQILICSNKIPSVTTISNSFIQKYMLDANGSYVKVYLYLSMCIQSGNVNFSISSLADQMENTENDIIRALQHWEKKKLLHIQWHESGEYITAIDFLNPDESSANIQSDSVSSQQKAGDTDVPTKQTQFSPSVQEEKNSDPPETPAFSVTPDQTMRLAEDSDFTWICQIVETFLNRPIQSAEVQLLAYLFDTLHFSKDLILYLYEYCVSLGKTNVKYVQAVALSWADNNITTPEQAENLSASYSSSHTAISKALALGRTLAGIECQYVDRWLKEWNMDLSVVLEACNRTMLTIQKPDFKYLDGILSNWHKNDVHTLQDISRCDEAHAMKQGAAGNSNTPKKYRNSSPKKNQFQSFQQRDVSQEEMNQLEKILLSR